MNEPVIPTQDQYLDVLTWLREEVYPGLVLQPLDDRGIVAWLCETYTRERQAVAHLDAKHRVFKHIKDVVQPPPALAPMSLRAPLGIARNSFVDAAGVPRFVVMCHAGNLFGEWLRNRDKAKRVISRLRARGYYGSRWWTRCRGDWWVRNFGEWGQEITSRYWDEMSLFIEAHRDEGLVFHTGAGDLRFIGESAEDEYIDGMSALANTYAAQFAYFEYVNEARDTDDTESDGRVRPYDALRDMERFRRLTGERILCGLSAYTGHEDHVHFGEWTAPWMRHRIVHVLRGGRWWDKIRHLMGLRYEQADVPWLHGEPWGVGRRVSAMENQHELTPERMALGAAQASLFGGWWTFFSSPGVIVGDEQFDDQPGFAETPRVVAALQRALDDRGLVPGQMRMTHGGVGRDNVFEIDRSSGPHARIDQLVSTDRRHVVATIYGPQRVHWREKGRVKKTALNLETGEWAELDAMNADRPCVVVGELM